MFNSVFSLNRVVPRFGGSTHSPRREKRFESSFETLDRMKGQHREINSSGRGEKSEGNLLLFPHLATFLPWHLPEASRFAPAAPCIPHPVFQVSQFPSRSHAVWQRAVHNASGRRWRFSSGSDLSGFA